MTNEEKKRYILDLHELIIKHHPYDINISMEEILPREKTFWSKYFLPFYSLLPKTFFKYRKPTEYSFQDFEKDEAWFSNPKDFDDTTDSRINNDIETEIKEFKSDPRKALKEVAVAIVFAYLRKANITFSEEQIDDALPLLNKDGTFNKQRTRLYLQGKLPKESIELLIKTLNEKVGSLTKCDNTLKTIKKLLDFYSGINDRITSEAFTYSLAEEGDNQSMWASMADESKGFCIEYEISNDTFIGQRMLMNMQPVFYGDKPFIKFFDVIKRSLPSKHLVDNIDFDDYQTIFLSTFTKNKEFESQKEWRITFDKRFGENHQSFPFIKSVILGERMTEENKNRIIKAAKDKGISVYQRDWNLTGSAIIIKKIL